ncbi:hypothetical protein CLU79DRAFT_150412 [Phycomyces nitens]|nr:hypothetical protein CLU79DRAFT_150412 [Phycomyces nitens]
MLKNSNTDDAAEPETRSPSSKQQKEKELPLKRKLQEADTKWIVAKAAFVKTEKEKVEQMKRSNDLMRDKFEIQVMSKDLLKEIDSQVVEFYNLKRDEILARMKSKRKENVGLDSNVLEEPLQIEVFEEIE